MGMMGRAGRVLEVLHEDRSAGDAISPELPSRRDQSRRRRGLEATQNMEQPALQAAGFRAVDRSIGGGSLPARLSARRPRVGFASMRANRSVSMGFRETPSAERVE